MSQNLKYDGIAEKVIRSAYSSLRCESLMIVDLQSALSTMLNEKTLRRSLSDVFAATCCKGSSHEILRTP